MRSALASSHFLRRSLRMRSEIYFYHLSTQSVVIRDRIILTDFFNISRFSALCSSFFPLRSWLCFDFWQKVRFQPWFVHLPTFFGRTVSHFHSPVKLKSYRFFLQPLMDESRGGNGFDTWTSQITQQSE